MEKINATNKQLITYCLVGYKVKKYSKYVSPKNKLHILLTAAYLSN